LFFRGNEPAAKEQIPLKPDFNGDLVKTNDLDVLAETVKKILT
jgi:hypothetical protein